MIRYKDKVYIPGQLRVCWLRPCPCGDSRCPDGGEEPVVSLPVAQSQLDAQLAHFDNIKHPYTVEVQRWEQVGP